MANSKPALDLSKRGTCQVCNKTLESKRNFYCPEHKPEPKKPAKKKTISYSENISTDAKPVEVIQNIVNPPQSSPIKTAAPSAVRWEITLGTLVVFLSSAIVSLRARGLDLPSELRDQLLLTDDEANSIVEPLSKKIATTAWNAEHGKDTLEWLSYVPVLFSLVEWNTRVSRVINQIKQEQQQYFEEQGVVQNVPIRQDDEENASPEPGGTPDYSRYGNLSRIRAF